MFDSVRLATNELELNTSKLRARGWTKTTHEHDGAEGIPQVVEYWRPDLKRKHPHFLQYSPKRGELKLETSLPKILAEDNVKLITPDEIDKCFDVMSDRVSSWVGCDIPHVSSWDVRGRADCVFAWQVGAHVDDYLHAFKNVPLSRHTSQSIDRDATLYWRSGQRVIRMYDKEKESGLKAAHGLLRFEVQMNHAKGELERLTGATSTKAKDVLTWEKSRAILSNYLQGLGSDLLIVDEEKCLKMLAAEFGMTRAVRLFGYVQAMRHFSKDELVRQGMRRETLWRAGRDINSAGANLGSTKSGVLRPLNLPEDYTGDAGRA